MPSLTPFGKNVLNIEKTLITLATETEKTAERFARDCQSSRRHGAEGPGQLLVGIGDLGCSRGRDGYAPVPRRGRVTSIILF
jgi:hypothetical protein